MYLITVDFLTTSNCASIMYMQNYILYIYVIYVYLLYTDTVFVTRMKLFNITKYAKLRHYLYAYILTCILCSRYNCLRMK